MGGSTNAIIHLLALAGRVGVPLTLDRFDEIEPPGPLIANVQPAGEHLTERLMTAGGVPAFLQCPFSTWTPRTVDGRTIGEIIEPPRYWTPSHPAAGQAREDRRNAGRGAGNLAPDGAVMKACAADPRLFRHRGRAVVFEDVQTIADRIDDPALEIDENSVLILRNAGPSVRPCRSGACCRCPRRLLERGVRDMLRISDARMSGTAYGAAVSTSHPRRRSAARWRWFATATSSSSTWPSGDSTLVDEDELERRAPDGERRRSTAAATARSMTDT